MDLNSIKTEQRNSRTAQIDTMSTLSMVKLINEEDKKVAVAVGDEAEHIAQAVDVIAAQLKQGGRLVYSTCTIDPAENEEQVRAFVGRHPEFRVVTPDVRFPAGMTVGDWGALSVPTRTGMDGFFLCALQKTR